MAFTYHLTLWIIIDLPAVDLSTYDCPDRSAFTEGETMCSRRIVILLGAVALILVGCAGQLTSPTPAATLTTTEPSPPVSAATPSATASQLGSEGTCTEYTVKAGDTLPSIAQAHGITLAELIADNPEQSIGNTLHIGQTICVTPRSGGWVPTAVPSPSPTPMPSGVPSNLVFDWRSLVSDINSGVWTTEYPNLSAAAVYAVYKSALAKYPVLTKVIGTGAQIGVGHLGGNGSDFVGWDSLRICFGIYLQPTSNVQGEAMDAACPFAVARLIWYVNQTGNRAALPLIADVIGWVAHWIGSDPSGQDRGNFIYLLNDDEQYLDGACDATGTWACL